MVKRALNNSEVTLELVRTQAGDYRVWILGHRVPTTAVPLFGKVGGFSVLSLLLVQQEVLSSKAELSCFAF